MRQARAKSEFTPVQMEGHLAQSFIRIDPIALFLDTLSQHFAEHDILT